MKQLLEAKDLSASQLTKENHYECNTFGNYLADNLLIIGQCNNYFLKRLVPEESSMAMAWANTCAITWAAENRNGGSVKISEPWKNVGVLKLMAEDFVIPIVFTRVDIVALPKNRLLAMISTDLLPQLAVTRTGEHLQWHRL